MITVGNLGDPWRASVTPTGGLLPWDSATPPIDWYIAADDRWHIPAREPAVRQRRVDGTAVVETRVRVPTGDVVQRIYSTANGGGITVIEVENESTLPVAIAFDRRGVLTERAISSTAISGIDLPTEAFVLPLGHAATLRVGVPHGARRDGALPKVPSSAQVMRGWLGVVERPSRFVLPAGELGSELAERVSAQRGEIALGAIPAAADDPSSYAVAIDQLVRMGELADPWVPELADAVAALGPLGSWAADVGLDAATRILAAADETRASRDLARSTAGRQRARRPLDAPGGVLDAAWLDERFVSGTQLLPGGLPSGWLGQSFEVYGVPVVGKTTVSYGVRWHGQHPAILWEQSGPAQTLIAPAIDPTWSTSEPVGEALWSAFTPPTA